MGSTSLSGWAIAGCLLGLLLSVLLIVKNHKQQYYITRLMQTVDDENTLASNAFIQTKRMGQAGGKGTTEAEQFAATSLKGRIAVQSAIVAMKDITGQTVLLLLGAAGMVLLLPYHKKETT